MVLETILWMKVRALSTQDKFTPANLLPGALQVPYKRTPQNNKARIPKQKKSNLIPRPAVEAAGTFMVTDAADVRNLAELGVNEISNHNRGGD